MAKIEFGCPIVGTAEEIAKFSEDNDQCSYDEMYEYFKGKTAYAIPILSVEQFSNSISLEDLKKEFLNFSPPQSYYYLDDKPTLMNYIDQYSKKV